MALKSTVFIYNRIQLKYKNKTTKELLGRCNIVLIPIYDA